MGYGGSRADAAEAIGKSGDEGLDGLIKKRTGWVWTLFTSKQNVGQRRWADRKFRSSLAHSTANMRPKAFSSLCKIGSKIVSIDRPRLAELMIEFGVAVATDATYTVKRIDYDFFETI